MLLMLAAAGCGSPSRANIELRKENQSLHQQVDQLKRQRAGDEQVIKGLRQQHGTLQTLAPDRLDKLFTTHGLEFGRLSGGVKLDPARAADDALAIYVVPIDQDGQKLKAAGTFVIEAFDLSAKDNPRVGRWTFDLDQARKAWNGWFLEYNYVLTCPWQTPPRHPDLTVKVTFNDELTQTPFTGQREIRVTLAPSTQPHQEIVEPPRRQEVEK